MRENETSPECSELLANFSALGGVVHFVLLQFEPYEDDASLHQAAALLAMTILDRRLQQHAVKVSIEQEIPIDKFFRLTWNAEKMQGRRISFSEFWGTDDVRPTKIGENAWTEPSVDGYKTAFFLTPHGLRGSFQEQSELFAKVNQHFIGEHPETAEILSWSTDWSNYFDAGNEWCGAYYWTIRHPDSLRITVIGASTTD